MSTSGRCLICGRPLDDPNDRLSADCGGDCWGCIGKIEADLGDETAMASVAQEIECGDRLNDGTAKPPGVR